MMQIIIDGRPVEAKADESLLSMVKRLGLDTDSLKTRPLAADIAGEVFTLNYIPMRQKEQGGASVDAVPEGEQNEAPTTLRMRKAIRKSNGDIKLIRYSETRGKAIYERTMLYVFFLAMRELFPHAKTKVNYAIGAGIDISVDMPELPFSQDDVEAVRAKMREIVQADYPLIRKRLSIADAIRLFEQDGQEDKVRLLKWRRFTYFDVYVHEDYADYFYGEMCPSTAYASVFDLQHRNGGLFLLRPSTQDADIATRYVYQPNLSKAFATTDRWTDLMHCRCVADLNAMVEDGSVRELIRVNEALHERRFAEIATEIVNRGARAVLIAGPSSSGKTTSANRVATQLRVLGKTPILLSLDDYYIDRSLIQPDENGEFDYEHINMIDVPQFNEDLEALLEGKRVEIPHFDFKTGTRQMIGHYVQLRENAVLIIEGLHALNPMLLTPRIDKRLIFKLYVSALATLNLDDHNRIPTTDVRLLRRMMRDYETRGATIERTLGMWESVKRGEQRWIFPYQESADEIMNTTLVYELAVLKKHLYPLLQAVESSSPCYDEVIGTIKFLNYIQDAAVEDEIPPTSILREFVGGNAFYR